MLELGPAGDHVSLLPNDGLTWDELAAPPTVHEALRELAGDVALAGHAIPALLTGPERSTTTMAARVVTAALRLDLVEVRARGFAGDADSLVPSILDQARSKHVSLLFADAELLGAAALEAALSAAPTLRGMLLFAAPRQEHVGAALRESARLIEIDAAGRGD